MSTITKAYSEVNGAVAQASSINRVFDDIYSTVNNSIGSSNLLASGVTDSAIAQEVLVHMQWNNDAFSF